MADTLPAATRRLFAHYANLERLPETSAPLVMARLMEEGDGSDLRWLTGRYPESDLSDWLDQHGLRQLSRRSHSFWRAVLDRPTDRREAPGEPLWPL